MPRPHWRAMTWVILIWCAAIVAWAIAGGVSADHQSAQQCLNQGVLSARDCQNAADAGTGIGVAAILFIGFVGFVFLSLIWFMTGRRRRDCPVCGRGIKGGKTVCPTCGHDFARATSGTPLGSQPDSTLRSA